MGFNLEQKEVLPSGLQRIVSELIAEMHTGLRDASVQEEAIHQTRTGCKKIRALLRLVKGNITPDVFAIENVRYRNISRELSLLREAFVFVETVESLRAEVAQPVPAINTLLEFLTEAYNARKAQSESSPAIEQALIQIDAARSSLDTWIPSHAEPSLFMRGLAVTYKEGKKRMRLATEEPSSERLHEWRKSVKHLMYQVRIFIPSQPEALSPLDASLQVLSDLLGSDHDFSALAHFLLDSAALQPAELDELLPRIARKRIHLQEAAWMMGGWIYHEDAQVFANRLISFWARWHAF